MTQANAGALASDPEAQRRAREIEAARVRAVRSPVWRVRQTHTIAVASPIPMRRRRVTRRHARQRASITRSRNPDCKPEPCSASVVLATRESSFSRFGNPPDESENDERALAGRPRPSSPHR